MPQSAPLQWTYFYLLTYAVLIAIFRELWYFGAIPKFSFYFKGYSDFPGGIWGWR